MTSLLIKKMRLLVLFFLLFLPVQSEAFELGSGLLCSDYGGSCAVLDDCIKILDDGAYNGLCALNKVCCETTEEENCEASGGTCTSLSECQKILSDGAYNSYCVGGKICCEKLSEEDEKPPTAEEYQEGTTGGFLLLKGHLVPCGRQSDDPGTENDETVSCTLCHLFLLMKNIFDLILSLLIVVSILMITVGGVVYIVSTGNTSLTNLAKDIISKTLKGFGFMMAGWLLVYTLLQFLSAGEMIGKGSESWFEFTCDEESRFDSN